LGVDDALIEDPFRVKVVASKCLPVGQDVAVAADDLHAGFLIQRNVLTSRAFRLTTFLGARMFVILYTLDQFPRLETGSIDAIEQCVSLMIGNAMERGWVRHGE
jgi:hypothetical protein